MPAPLRYKHPSLDLETAQEQVRQALKKAQAVYGKKAVFLRAINAELALRGKEPVNRVRLDYWIETGHFIHADYYRAIEVVTDMLVTRRQLRPDVYGINGPP